METRGIESRGIETRGNVASFAAPHTSQLAAVSSARQELVRVAVEAMFSNLQDVTMDRLASSVYFSKFHFTRIFQRSTGYSPGRFLAELRVLEAGRLLATTDLSFTEITHRVGYFSVGTFSSRFKAAASMSPTTYRQRVKSSGASYLAWPWSPQTARAAALLSELRHGEALPIAS